MTVGSRVAGLLAGCLAFGVIGQAGSAAAAEKVVLSYGFLSMAIPMEDLETLAETGETSNQLSQLLNLAGQEPDQLQVALNQPIQLNPVVLSLALNSPAGEWMLDQASETIQPASGGAGRLALRSAIIGAAADDDEITLLEVMQVYPSSEIVVQGDRLLDMYNRFSEVLEPLADLAEILGTLGQD